MAGEMVHLEIPAGDTAKAREFWGSLFGWQFEEFAGSPTEYHMTRLSETSGGAIYSADGDKRGTRVYFDVDDINAGESTRGRSRRRGGRRHARADHGLVRDLRRHRGQRVRALADGSERRDAGRVRRAPGGGDAGSSPPLGSRCGRTWGTDSERERHALLSAPRRASTQAPHRLPRERDALDRGGHGTRGLLGKRVDPLPPRLALPCQGGRRVHADRARGVDPRNACPQAPEHA